MFTDNGFTTFLAMVPMSSADSAASAKSRSAPASA